MQRDYVQDIVGLIESWGAFQSSHPGEDTRAFAFWLLAKTQPEGRLPTQKKVALEAPTSLDRSQFKYYDQMTINVRMSALLRRLGKFQHLQSKRLLQSLGILNQDEFGYLATLYGLVHANRTELNNINLNEHTTGTAIVKRLQEAGFIEERLDKEDKRSKKIRLTAKGKNTVMKAFDLMTQMADDFFNVFEKNEKEAFNKIVTRLNEKLTLEHFEK